ncbi:MAG TPA: hypothetical protein VMH36_08865 [Alphaproteobacteria bacterium]|nr:hypothetical protein [Alphaproteobacteria bacterium]
MPPASSSAESSEGRSRPLIWKRKNPMMDVIYLALGAALFAILAAYAYGCEKL